MTITLMAVVVVPIMSAVATSIKSSSQTRSAAQVETALVNAADRVNRADMRCDYDIYVAGRRAVAGLGPEPGVGELRPLPARSNAERPRRMEHRWRGVFDPDPHRGPGAASDHHGHEP